MIASTEKPGLALPGRGSKMRLAQESKYPEAVMTRNDLDPLILDLLEWIGREPRSYADVIDAWRTSCPRLTVWEDAMDRGFAVREHVKGGEVMIRLTAEGREFLRVHGRIVDVSATLLVSRARCST
jgi:hypothetical protein